MKEEQEFFRDVVERTNYWTPSEEFMGSEGFRDELLEFLEDRLNRGSSLIGDSEGVPVKEKRNSDIEVDEQIVLHVEKDFSSISEGKEDVEDLLSDFDFIVFIACGVENIEEWRELEIEYRGTSTRKGEVEFIWKSDQLYGEEHESNRRGEKPLGGLL
jgi:hypothetical protein